jgi:hypothetical protein
MKTLSIWLRALLIPLLIVMSVSVAAAQWQRMELDTNGGILYFFANEDVLAMNHFNVLKYYSEVGNAWKVAAAVNRSPIYSLVQRRRDYLAILVGQNRDSIYRSTDRGRSWTPYGVQPLQTRARDFMEDGSVTYMVGSSMLRLRETDSTWELLENFPKGVGSFRAIARDDKYYYLGTSKGGMLRSSDSGKTWLSDTIGLGARDIGRFVIADSVALVSLYTGGVYRSINHGDTWTNSKSTFPESVVVERMFRYGWVVFASTDKGVYRTTDCGATWEVFNTGFPTKVVLQGIGMGNHRGYLYAGISDQGVYRMPLKEAFPSASIVDLDTLNVGAVHDTLLPAIVRNTTADSLFFAGVELLGDDMSDFDIVSSPGAKVIAPGETISIGVRFSPVKPRHRHTTLVVRTVDRTGTPTRHRFHLMGEGSEGGYEIITTSVNFGMIQLGSQDSQTIAAIRVTGAGVIGVDSINVSGADASAFYIVGGSFDTTLNTGDLLSLQVGFRPGRVDTLTGALRVWGGGSVLAGISLRGIGTKPPVSVPGDRSLLTELMVVPSPVIGRGMIRYVATYVGKVSIGLYNMQSQQVWSQEGVIANPGEQLWTMDVRDLPDGVYIVRVVANGSVLTRKVVVAR